MKAIVLEDLSKPFYMKMHRILTTLFLIGTLGLLFALPGCSPGDHFITNRTYRKEVQKDYEARRTLAVHRDEILFGVMSLHDATIKEREALQFLFAYMPWADLAEYNGAFFLDNVRHSFMVQEAMPWGKTIPEDIFRHYVLPVRVNNESLDSARWVFYRELEARVKGLSLENAALEVNRWCHEKVTYKSTDGRTSSPLNTVMNAYGRCGEESVFTVAALRSVGIPARQVYVPRWAHSDDNHAWVEVWIDGTWKYLGACEPEPALNRGWFTGPAKRAMLVHTRVFGKYRGDEEVVTSERDYAVINSTAIYAEVTQPTVTVVDEKGNPVEHAKVEFGLYNYAEFYPIATLITDQQGRCSISIGKGDILLHATDGTRCTWNKHNLRTDSIITLTLKTCELPPHHDVWHFDIPDEVAAQTESLPELVVAEHKRLLAQEDSIRNAYTATFPTREQLALFAQQINAPEDSIVKYLSMSQGNYQEIMSFLKWLELQPMVYYQAVQDNVVQDHVAQDYVVQAAFHLFRMLTEKDLRDTRAETLIGVMEELPSSMITVYHAPIPIIQMPGLQSYYGFSSPSGLPISYYTDKKCSHEIFMDHVFNPKVDLELLKPYKQLLYSTFSKLKGKYPDPKKIFNWIRDSIRVDTTPYYSRILMTPSGVHNLRVTDPYSRNIYFVAVCRSMGIPARLEPATKIPQAWIENQWVDFNFEAKTDLAETVSGSLVIRKPMEDSDPAYYNRFTIGRLENGAFKTLEFPWGQPLSVFTFPLDLKPGNYAITSGLRQPTGDIDVVRQYFRIVAGEPTTFTFPVPEPQKTVAGIWPKPIAPAMEKGFIFLLLEATGEPSRHLMQELQNAFAARTSGMPPVFIQWSEKDPDKIKSLMVRYGLENKVTILPFDSALVAALQQMLPESATRSPLAAGVSDQKEVLFIAGGYQINSIQRMKELIAP
jgi:transglutaminase-like putative cysteine protease